jgi:hypothetical protein
MINNKDLIEQLSKYPDDTEWKSIFNRAILSDEGIIDFNSSIKNDTASQTEEPKPTLTEIVNYGKQRMMKAVELVIAKHEIEINKENKETYKFTWSKRESALASIGRYGNCHDSLHSLRMDVIYGFGLGGQCQSQSMGIGGGRWL